jgi:argininosuccinate lyase
MSLDKILSISGKPGLYELKARTRAGFVAESLVDGKKMAVGAHNNVSMLSEIAIYTYSEEVPLREVFQKIAEKEDAKETISHKSSKKELENLFSEILPEYDEDRVYISDIKKVIQWYNLLIKNNVTDFSETEASSEEE